MKIENIAAVEVFGWWWWLPVDRRLLSGKAVQAAGSVVIFSVTKVIDKPRSTRSHPSQANAPRVLHNTYPCSRKLKYLHMYGWQFWGHRLGHKLWMHLGIKNFFLKIARFTADSATTPRPAGGSLPHPGDASLVRAITGEKFPMKPMGAFWTPITSLLLNGP
ncbi:hypothetical protein PGT21_014208 [Puccinia graminis f. sp. tritici]|uniref:Uncharacterized protein n=1 Tax=Puccinia graminis f. sp. tritici TaxID=56615 RepID=A0A5B0MXI9_PUCGR|nr:hypothetical protein PGT21_014208 [Puccinia graminis f. sp. tritici]